LTRRNCRENPGGGDWESGRSAARGRRRAMATRMDHPLFAGLFVLGVVVGEVALPH
jgi:hypothetical protein